MGLLVDDDAMLFRGFFKEMAKLRGIRVLYQHPNEDKHYSIYSELETTYSKPIKIDIIFDQNPKQKTLRTHGWYSEDKKDDTPYIADVPFDVPHLQRGSRIIIPFGANPEDAKPFRVAEISTVIVYPDARTVKLVPDIPDDVPKSKSNYQDTNENYLKSEEGED